MNTIFPISPSNERERPDFGSINVNSVFVPVIPVFESKKKAKEIEGYSCSSFFHLFSFLVPQLLKSQRRTKDQCNWDSKSRIRCYCKRMTTISSSKSNRRRRARKWKNWRRCFHSKMRRNSSRSLMLRCLYVIYSCCIISLLSFC
jgi:hypothetical protein